jgi:hypothetical protein
MMTIPTMISRAALVAEAKKISKPRAAKGRPASRRDAERTLPDARRPITGRPKGNKNARSKTRIVRRRRPLRRLLSRIRST